MKSGELHELGREINRKSDYFSFYLFHDKAHEAHLISRRIPKYTTAGGWDLALRKGRNAVHFLHVFSPKHIKHTYFLIFEASHCPPMWILLAACITKPGGFAFPGHALIFWWLEGGRILLKIQASGGLEFGNIQGCGGFNLFDLQLAMFCIRENPYST